MAPRPGARRTKGGREATLKKGSPNSNGGEEGRYAITNAYFWVIVRGAMKETTCNYHCYGCINHIGRSFFFLLSQFLLFYPEATLIFAF